MKKIFTLLACLTVMFCLNSCLSESSSDVTITIYSSPSGSFDFNALKVATEVKNVYDGVMKTQGLEEMSSCYVLRSQSSLKKAEEISKKVMDAAKPKLASKYGDYTLTEGDANNYNLRVYFAISGFEGEKKELSHYFNISK